MTPTEKQKTISEQEYPCQNLSLEDISKTEAAERHIKELQAVKDKAIKAYISTCTKNEMGCVA